MAKLSLTSQSSSLAKHQAASTAYFQFLQSFDPVNSTVLVCSLGHLSSGQKALRALLMMAMLGWPESFTA